MLYCTVHVESALSIHTSTYTKTHSLQTPSHINMHTSEYVYIETNTTVSARTPHMDAHTNEYGYRVNPRA